MISVLGKPFRARASLPRRGLSLITEGHQVFQISGDSRLSRQVSTSSFETIETVIITSQRKFCIKIQMVSFRTQGTSGVKRNKKPLDIVVSMEHGDSGGCELVFFCIFGVFTIIYITSVKKSKKKTIMSMRYLTLLVFCKSNLSPMIRRYVPLLLMYVKGRYKKRSESYNIAT